MALVVDASVGGSASNSYLTLDEANVYFEARPSTYTSTWTGSTSGNREASIVWATQLIDSQFDWYGTKWTEEQRLRWPRIGVYDRDKYLIDSDEIPEELKEACAEMAQYLLKEDRTAEAGTEGLRSLTAGPVKLDFDKSDRKVPMPDAVYRLISHLGTLKGGISSHGGAVRLERA